MDKGDPSRTNPSPLPQSVTTSKQTQEPGEKKLVEMSTGTYALDNLLHQFELEVLSLDFGRQAKLLTQIWEEFTGL